MKARMLFVLLAVFVFSFSLVVAQGTGDCTAKTAGTQKACCLKGAKTAMATEKTCDHATATTVSAKNSDEIVKVSDHCATMAKDASHCTMKAGQMAEKCTEAQKAECEAAMKAGKTSCGKDKAKMVESKGSSKKTKLAKAVTEVKGTN